MLGSIVRVDTYFARNTLRALLPAKAEVCSSGRLWRSRKRSWPPRRRAVPPTGCVLRTVKSKKRGPKGQTWKNAESDLIFFVFLGLIFENESFNNGWRVLSQLDRDMLDMFGQSPARSGK